jgi:hypothetical protein
MAMDRIGDDHDVASIKTRPRDVVVDCGLDVASRTVSLLLPTARTPDRPRHFLTPGLHLPPAIRYDQLDHDDDDNSDSGDLWRDLRYLLTVFTQHARGYTCL